MTAKAASAATPRDSGCAIGDEVEGDEKSPLVGALEETPADEVPESEEKTVAIRANVTKSELKMSNISSASASRVKISTAQPVRVAPSEDAFEITDETIRAASSSNISQYDTSVPGPPAKSDECYPKKPRLHEFPISSPKTMCGFSLDKEVASVDLVLYRFCRYAILFWLSLIAFSYWAAPRESIVRLEGTEKNVALIELSILGTAVIMRHGPLLWDMKRDFGCTHPRISGVLAGGLTVQFIAIFTVVWMVSVPVPVMIDPVFNSRVHLLRWCEWTPLAGFMTLLMQCIDAPVLEQGKWSSHMKQKLLAASMESFSTFCGLLFPFCPNLLSWYICMIISFLTYFYIFYSYSLKVAKFRGMTRGRSEDDIELYERSRLSLALHWMCCFTWTMITVMYFVGSCGYMFVPKTYKWIHDPAIMMIEECFMDCVAKILYMSLIIEAHDAAFDEAKRANRRLAELKNTMSVVWENSSDTIAISVQKMSGSITSMISPSFFREALMARKVKLNDISAVVVELDGHSRKKRIDSFTNVASRVEIGDLPTVGMKIIGKEDFAQLDLHSPVIKNIFDPVATQPSTGNLDFMTYRVVAFTDMLSRAWQTKTTESVFEHDVDPRDGSGPRTKFEVKVTRLEENAVVVVVRDVSERYRRFEAEKRFVFETTARQKDAEANRFTRHEVKNGILAAIEICSNIREQISADFNKLQTGGAQLSSSGSVFSDQSMSSRVESITELDMTLHEVLDIVLAETMARDVIHGMYEPKLNRVDINHLLSHMRGFTGSSEQFSLISSPSPLPVIVSDQGLFKCIHGNAIRNALKYGKRGGKITTVATYSSDTGIFEMKVINLPGPGHQKLVDLGSRASDLVFSHGTRLHKDAKTTTKSLSAGDGAWIIRKCASILGGEVGISFEPEQTVFVFRAPVQLYDTSSEANSFVIPSGVWGIAIDDSKIQRKLLRRFFVHAGIPEHHQIILGQNSEEISSFVEFTVDFVERHPDDLFFVIADENLELGEDSQVRHGTISGSKCIQQILRGLDPEDEKRVLALVRSANDSPTDLSLYLSRAHGYMPKVPLRVLSVKETVYPLWVKRFPDKKDKQQSEGGDPEEGKGFSRISSLENLRDLTLISSAELLHELEQIDEICIRDQTELNADDRWHSLWDKLHQLKGDLKSANVDDKFSETIEAIETMRGDTAPTDFMKKWLKIRSKVILHANS
eukprot:CCRYP_009976-RA/>CCRYP_009976-RA protein AED:0.28 eAED:0.28 QI:429/1/1/1/1/1/3/820/1200